MDESFHQPALEEMRREKRKKPHEDCAKGSRTSFKRLCLDFPRIVGDLSEERLCSVDGSGFAVEARQRQSVFLIFA